MGKHRSRLRIVADILLVVRDGAKKTQIMRRANLNYKLLGRYLTDVIEAGLIRFGDANSYTLTPRGWQFLNGYQEYSRRYRQLEEQINDVSHQRVVLEKMCSNLDKVDDDLKKNVLSGKQSDKHNFVRNLK